MSKEIKKGTLIVEKRKGSSTLFAFHIIICVGQDRFTRLEFLKENYENKMRILKHSIGFFKRHERDFIYKYINKG